MSRVGATARVDRTGTNAQESLQPARPTYPYLVCRGGSLATELQQIDYSAVSIANDDCGALA